MIRITQEATEKKVTLRVEGKLVGPWVDEMRVQCSDKSDNDRALFLDLSEVSFVDGAGISLVRELMNRGVRITGCSSFVAELLTPERN